MTLDDEGCVKYTSDWTPGPPPHATVTTLLDWWRRPLFDAGLIGHYLGIGFGNISVRFGKRGQFVISGTQTGHVARTGDEHYALVTDCDITANRVACTGPVQASSEAMTHAALYRLSPRINAVVHVHSAPLWRQLAERLPATREDIPYGTPEMANELARLYRDTGFSGSGIAVMAGHEEGLISIGATLEEAATRILRLDTERDAD